MNAANANAKTRPAYRGGLDDLPSAALRSSASADWGSPEIIRRFAAAVLRPAALGPTAIDMDAATSDYWQAQWSAADRPARYMDGSAGKNGLSAADWGNGEIGAIGSVYCNAPGDPSGGSVQDFHRVLVDMHARELIDSVVWIGFSLEQLRTLIPRESGSLHPLDARAMTMFPSARVPYTVHPASMIAMLERKLAKVRTELETAALRKRIVALQSRADDSPVSGPSPTHASFVTVYWAHHVTTRRKQQAAARKFLAAQAGLKGPLARAVCVGDVGD